MTRVKLPDGRYAKFPDSMSKEQILTVLRDKFPSGNSEKKVSTILGDMPAYKKMSLDLPTAKNPLDFVKDIGIGLGQAGQGIASTLTGGYAPTVNMEQELGLKNPDVIDKIVQGLATYAPFGVAGGSGLMGQLGAGGAYGFTQTNPNENNLGGILPKGKLGGGIESTLINLLTHGAFKGIEALRPSKLLKGNLTPEQLAENLEVTAGTPTSLGDVIENPTLKHQYENVLTKVPFSGANQKLAQSAIHVQNKGYEILDKLKGNSDVSNIGESIKNSLKNELKSQKQINDINYKKLDDIADEVKLNVHRNDFSKTASNVLNEINESPELKRQLSKEILEDLNFFKNNSQGNSLRLSNIFRSKLGEKANELFKSGKDYESGIYSRLKNSLDKDIKDSIDNSGNDQLKSLYKNAQKHYEENIATFKDPDIKKFLRKNADTDLLLQYFIKNNKISDRSNLIKKITNKIPEQDRKLMSYGYFSKALDKKGNLKPAKLANLIESLGENQFKALIPEENMRNALKKYIDLYNKNSNAVKLMFNPPTGQRNLDILPAFLAHSVIGTTGAIAGGLTGLLGGLVAPSIISKLLVKVLTSEKIRENLVKAIIENKSWNKNIVPGIQGGMQGLSQRR